MALIDMLRNGSNAYVAWLYGQGYGHVAIYNRLQARFPGQPGNSLWAAVNRGQEAWRAGGQLTAGSPTFRLPLGAIPGGPCNGPGVRYTVVANVADASTGTIYQRTFQIGAQSSRSLNELSLDTLAAAQARYTGGGQRRPESDVPTSFIIAGINVVAAERDC